MIAVVVTRMEVMEAAMEEAMGAVMEGTLLPLAATEGATTALTVALART